MALSSKLIAVDRLVKRYGDFTALKGISLEIEQGEFVALLGPSGCGKTTLLRMIAGFDDPTDGEIRIDGQRMNGVQPNRRPVNTVFQNYALFPHLTVAKNVAFGPRRQGRPADETRRLVGEALEMVGMGQHGRRYPSELSGGQQQRIALARAIINRPRVLLLDEPLGALDLQLRKRMQLELKHLQSRLGITFVFVTHDQEEALVMANRIAVMNEGQVMQIGSGEAIYRDPANRFVASFIGDANLLRTRVAGGGVVAIVGSTVRLRATTNGAAEKVVMVRPEDIVTGASRDPCNTSIDVTIRERVFLGGTSRIHASIGDEQPIVFQPARDDPADLFEPGRRLSLHWRQDRARILEA